MSGRDDPCEVPSAPGPPPGAGAFAGSSARHAPRAGAGLRAEHSGREPTGIVRLSDLVAPHAPAAHATGGHRPARDADAGGVPGAGPGGQCGDSPGIRRRSERRGRVGATRPGAGPNDPAGEADAASAAPSGGGPLQDPGVDWLGAAATACAGDGAPEEGPAYEPLFGGPGESRRPKRPVRPPPTATQRALGLLTRREHSRKELTRKLVARGVEVGEVEAAVEKLTNAGWQDDGRFAESLVRARASTGYGPLHIRAELATHDLTAEARAAALEAFDGDWAAIARDLVVRRFGRIEDPRLRERKAADFLLRRGFPSDIARPAARLDPADS